MMTSPLEVAIEKQLTDLSRVVQSKLNCNVLPYEVKNIADYDNDPAMQFHLPLLLVELQTDIESIKKSNKPTFICCLPVEIDEMDNLVSPTHGHLSDWDFEAWLEQKVLKTQVLSVGSVTHERHRFRTFKWLVQGPPASNRQASSNANYDGILSYFDRHPFGSEMPVLTLFSTLPPRDRCAILEVLRAKDPSNVEVYNKLSMAYLKNGQETKARAILKEGLDAEALDDYTFQQLDEKITFLKDNMQLSPQQEAAMRAVGAAPPKPSQSYAETLSILGSRFADDANGPFREFFSLLVKLCNATPSIQK